MEIKSIKALTFCLIQVFVRQYLIALIIGVGTSTVGDNSSPSSLHRADTLITDEVISSSIMSENNIHTETEPLVSEPRVSASTSKNDDDNQYDDDNTNGQAKAPRNNYACATDELFQLHFHRSSPSTATTSAANVVTPPLIALGMLQWGTTPIDNRLINGSRGVLTESEAREIYQAFRHRGVILFDTAEGYGGGTSEKRLGRLWKEEMEMHMHREIVKNDDGDTVDTVRMEKDGVDDATDSNDPNNVLLMTKFLPAPWRFTHAHFEKALRASNKRMGVSTCPIYLLHSPMHLSRKVEYWVEGAAICKKKGLLKTLGLSNCSADEVRRAVEAGRTYGVPVVLNQVHFSLLDYNSPALQEMQKTCHELGVSIIAYNSLGQGLLTDNMSQEKFQNNKPAKMMRIGWEDILPLRNSLRKIADARNNDKSRTLFETKEDVSMAQVALNWCRAHNTIPLVGCRSVRQAEDTLASLDWELKPEEVAELDRLALSRCTLDSPVWRRKLFVVLASLVMGSCRILDALGVGVVRKAAIGMK